MQSSNPRFIFSKKYNSFFSKVKCAYNIFEFKEISCTWQYNAVGTLVDYQEQSCGYNKLQLKGPCHRVSSLTNTQNVPESIRGRHQMNFNRMRKP